MWEKLKMLAAGDFVDAAYANSPDSISPALMKKLSEMQLDDEHITVQWCQECNVDLTQDHIDWPA